MVMKTNDFYMGRLDSNIYKKHNLVKAMYPDIRNFREYKAFSEQGLAIKTGDDLQVFKYFGSNFELPDPGKSKTIKLKGPADSQSIEYTIVYTKDENGFRKAGEEYNTFHRNLRDLHYKDTIDNHCPKDLEKVASTLYSEAWTRGHSAGFDEITNYFIDCVTFAEDILKNLDR